MSIQLREYQQQAVDKAVSILSILILAINAVMPI